MQKMATSNQLNRLRDWYAEAIGWFEANWWIQKLEANGFCSKDASAEINRVHTLRARGMVQSAKPLDYIPPTDEELEKFKREWCPF